MASGRLHKRLDRVTVGQQPQVLDARLLQGLLMAIGKSEEKETSSRHQVQDSCGTGRRERGQGWSYEPS